MKVSRSNFANRPMISCLLVLLLNALAISNVWAATGVRYVALGATGTGDGTSWANAYTTIGAAVNELNPYSTNNPTGTGTGGVIYVAAGTYTDTEGAITFNKPIKLEGAGRGITTISLSSAPIKMNGVPASGSIIRNLTVSTLAPTNANGIWVYGASDVLIADVQVTSPTKGIKIEREAERADRVKIVDSVFLNCNTGISVLVGASVFINNVRTEGAGAYGLYVAGGSTTDVPNVSSVNVANSQFIGVGPSVVHLIHINGSGNQTSTVKTYSLFANTTTQHANGSKHIYVGTSSNQFVNHSFVGIIDATCGINFAAGGNILGQYTGPTCPPNSTNTVWTNY